MTLAMNGTSQAALLAALLLAGPCPPAPAQSAGSPRQAAREPDDGDVMLTDRKPYCEHLAREVARLQKVVAGPHIEADRLAVDGVRLCGIGHLAPGIRRLRYALIELEEQVSGR